MTTSQKITSILAALATLVAGWSGYTFLEKVDRVQDIRAQVQALSDEELGEFVLVFVEEKQDAFFLQNGRYFPVARTGDRPEGRVAQNFGKRTIGRGDGYVDTFEETTRLPSLALPFSVEVQTCDDGTAKGYTIILERTRNGVPERLQRGHGACALDSFGWSDNSL